VRRPSRVLPVAIALFLVAMASLFAWTFLAGAPDGAQASAPGSAAPEQPRPARHVEPAAPAAERPPQMEAVADAPTRESAARLDALEAGLEDGTWITGRVVFPEGTPLDEEVRLVAIESGRHQFRRAYAVRPDGSFRVGFPGEGKRPKLELHARYLYMDVQPVDLDDSSPRSLSPALGGRIEGSVVAADLDSRELASLEGQAVRLLHKVRTGHPTQIRSQADAELDGELHFAFDGLDPAHEYQVALDLERFVDAELDGLELEPGVTKNIELELARGARISGRVVGEGGFPAQEVELEVWVKREGTSMETRAVEEDGTFDAAGVEPGVVAITAAAPGYARTRIDLGELADGDHRADVLLELSRGHFVEGLVQWPAGSPAVACDLTVIQPDEEWDPEDGFHIWSGDRDVEQETDDEGRFHVQGLDGGPCQVVAEAKRDGASWSTRLEDVPTDTGGLLLVLSRGSAIAGVVVDDSGAPLERFSVTARPAEREEWDDTGRVHDSFRKVEGGAFRLEGLYAGRWRVTAEARGHSDSRAQVVTVPGEGMGMVLTLGRTATLSGTVVDPAGDPIGAVQVTASPARAMWASGWGEDDVSARTGDDGTFELDDAPTGKVEVRAEGSRFAPSKLLELELEPGETRTGLLLALQLGGRITGEVVSIAGETVEGRAISLQSVEEGVGFSFGGPGDATTDAAGRFSFENLAPGKYVVSVSPSQEQMDAFEGDDGRADWAAVMGATKRQRVELEGAETVHVVLGPEPEAAIRVTGLVHRGGEPVPGVTLWASGGAEEDRVDPNLATTGADGRFELGLRAPGEYVFGVQLEGTYATFEETVPDVAVHEVSFELATGSIAGRVVGPDGEPLRVQVMISGGESDLPWGGMTTSDEDGTFRFGGLSAGTYAVTAGDPWNVGGNESEYGMVRREGLALADGGRIEDVELRMLPAASIQGTVRDAAGNAAIGASIFARDESGTAFPPYSTTTTDGAGRYRYEGLGVGSWTVSARRGRDVSPESRPVRLAAGGTAEVDLVLSAGTMLTVLAVDGEGQAVAGADVSVTDDDGREYSGIIALADQELYGSVWGPGRLPVVGPLARGEYTVRVTSGEHGAAERRVRVAGEPDLELRLELSEQP